MTDSTLVVSAIFAILSGALFGYVGWRLSKRQVAPENRLAQQSFVAWWAGLAGVTVVGAIQLVLYMTGNLPVWLFQTIGQLAILLLVYALASLTFYLVFLYTGSQRSGGWIAAYYMGFFVFLESLVFIVGPPQVIRDNGWSLTTLPVPQLAPWIGLAFVFFLVGPQFLAGIAYARLYRRAADATQRYRIGLVSGAILVWFGMSLVGAISMQRGVAWQIFSRMVSVAASLVILVAYLPPKAWRERWQLRSIADESA